MAGFRFIGGFLLFVGKLMLVVLVVFALALRAMSRATGVMGGFSPRL